MRFSNADAAPAVPPRETAPSGEGGAAAMSD